MSSNAKRVDVTMLHDYFRGELFTGFEHSSTVANYSLKYVSHPHPRSQEV